MPESGLKSTIWEKKHVINKKIVNNFENEISFTIDPDYTIVLYNKKDGTVMGEVYNKFDGCMEVDIDPQYEIPPLQIIIAVFVRYWKWSCVEWIWDNKYLYN